MKKTKKELFMKSISSDLWNEIEKFLPKKKYKIGRPEKDIKQALLGIMYILKNGSLWHELPEKFGKPSTVHGKFMKWCRLGIFQKIIKCARKYYMQRQKHKSWFAFDTLVKKAPLANFSGNNPTDRSKKGVKQTILVDKNGAPLYVDLAPANVHDSKLLQPIIQKLRRSKNKRILAADSAFDAKFLYQLCAKKNIQLDASTNVRRNKNKQKYYPKGRWVVERTFGWLACYRGLKICWAKSKISHLSFLQIACSIQLFKMSGVFV